MRARVAEARALLQQVRAAGSYKAYLRALRLPLVTLRRLCNEGRAGPHTDCPRSSGASSRRRRRRTGEEADAFRGARRIHRAHRAPRRDLPDDPARGLPVHGGRPDGSRRL